jgi:hypothetical protein
MRTLTRETVALLTDSFGLDFWPQGQRPTGFVRVPGGYISTHAAYELVLAGKLDPAKNIIDVHMEDARRVAAAEAPGLAVDAQLERDKVAARAANHARYLERVEREAKIAERNAAGMSADAGVRVA